MAPRPPPRPPSGAAEIVYVLVRGEVADVYGGEKSSIAQAAAVGRRGFRARFITTARDRFAEEVEAAGMECEVVPAGDPLAGFRAAGPAGWLRRLVDLARVNAAVFRAARQAKVVHTIAVPGFLCGFAGARLAGRPVVFHVRSAPGGLRANRLEQLAMLLANRTICVSQSLRDQLVATASPALRPLVAGRVRAIDNGFDFAELEAAAARAAPVVRGEGQLTALLVGGIWPRKGQLAVLEHVLPRVVDAEPRFHLTVIGGATDAAYHRACLDAVARRGLARHVTFTGYLDRREVFRHYLAADLLILPSEGEGLPRCAVEAAAFGLPVVATRTVGTVDVVVPGRTGILVAPGRPEEMADAVLQLLGDARLRARLGALAASHVRTRFAMAATADATARLYRELAGGSNLAACEPG
jgi:glycosyltransferase involved in cell wall biosynthesis